MKSYNLTTYAAQKRLEAAQILKRCAGKLRLFIMDVDRWGEESKAFIAGARRESPDTLVVVLTSDRQGWIEQLSNDSQVHILEKPLGIWSLHNLNLRIENSNDNRLEPATQSKLAANSAQAASSK